jgi:hypothetical protein
MKLQTMMRHILDPTKSDLSEEATNTYKIGFLKIIQFISLVFHLVSEGKESISNAASKREEGTSKINARGANCSLFFIKYQYQDDLATKGEKIPYCCFLLKYKTEVSLLDVDRHTSS